MIAYSKHKFDPRFNPILGSSYELSFESNHWQILFISANGEDNVWNFKTLEAAQQTLEWLDQLYGVKFIPNEILKQENKEND